jgi:xylulokinase
MDLVMGMDLGTTYFKVGLFDRQGALAGLGREAVPVEGPPPRAELPVAGFWATLKSALAEAMNQADASAGDIRAVGYSSQANSVLLLDADDQPLTPLVLWTDRTQTPSDAFVTLFERGDFLERTGLGVEVNPGFAALKLQTWRESDLWAKSRRAMTISDYLTFSLTGKHLADAGTSALLGLEETRELRWWPTALDALGLDASLLGELVPPGHQAGPARGPAADLLGLTPRCLLAVGSLDHHVAALGAGVGSLAEVSESTGTVLACLNLSDRWTPKPGCVAGPHVGRAGWFQLAFESDGAAVLEWYRRTHAPDLTFDDLASAAAEVPPGSEGLRAQPHANQQPGLRGFAGRQPRHGHGHYVRAIMEHIADTLADLLDTLRDEKPPRLLATGGGAVSDLWLQIKADRLGLEMVRSDCREPACRGAAMLAAVGAGWFDDLRNAQTAWVRASARFHPKK